ncbi:DJ-1/PfpI family protein [Lapidilactobacillus luobeiensis]|uniref:DJ-1/PfpI family protein n=1 Tax=Lapidilactobacillus luobeiensis TaxID=2950371 RepID=UPI0021C3BD6D|nr:DJ-1/PfpI family protein [Lapidilactobacillus luobeiensis]
MCGEVYFLAQNGLLTGYSHTGNAQYLWPDFSHYTNASDFTDKQAVIDPNLVTANGTAALEFTNLVLKMVNVADENTINRTIRKFSLVVAGKSITKITSSCFD